MLSIQLLGQAEPPLLDLEAELATTQAGIPQSLVLTRCFALSVYWMFGLYETLRTLRERVPETFAPLEPLFRDVEVARMPLAKHQIKNKGRYRDIEHFPTTLCDPASGRVGWHVFDPRAEAMVSVVRTEIADRFLAIEGPRA